MGVSRFHRTRAKAQFVLKTETSYPYLQSQVQSFEKLDDTAPVAAEEKAIATASKFFADKLSEIRIGIVGDLPEPSDRAIDKLSERLEEIRDLALGANVIEVRVDNEDDAYVIFETLNTRGLDLGLTDLLRNFILRAMKARNDELDQARDHFGKLLDSLQGTDPDVFFHHHWISHQPYTAKKKTFTAIKKAKKQADCGAYLDMLSADAIRYGAIVTPETRAWTKEEGFVPDTLAAIDMFRMKLPLPFLLSLLRKYDEKVVKLATVRRAVTSIESFHYLTTAVVGRSSSGGLQKMYASNARAVYEAKDAQAVGDVVNSLVQWLRDRRPTADEFRGSFAELAYSSQLTAQKNLVRYTLGRLLKATDEGNHLGNTDHLTIEHIAPENPSRRSSIPTSSVVSIGNLLLVDEKLNVKLANKPFTKKKPLLIAAPGVPMDRVLTDSSKWTAKSIENRTAHLADVAFSTVWNI